MTEHALDRLFAIVESRKGSDARESYTATLLAKGRLECARKLGEEAIETIVAATAQDNAAVVRESADLLYHLVVLWAACGVEPSAIYTELRGREKQSGLEEKAARKS